MRRLWFKQIYVKPILAGEKTDTIRSPDSRDWPVGQTVALSVGPRRPFAEAIVTAFESIPASDLGDRLAVVQSFYGQHPTYKRLAFRVTRVLDPVTPPAPGTPAPRR